VTVDSTEEKKKIEIKDVKVEKLLKSEEQESESGSGSDEEKEEKMEKKKRKKKMKLCQGKQKRKKKIREMETLMQKLMEPPNYQHLLSTE